MRMTVRHPRATRGLAATWTYPKTGNQRTFYNCLECGRVWRYLDIPLDRYI